MNLSAAEREVAWPALPFQEGQATAETLQLWTQIVGKIRLKLSPWINHSWHVTLYLTARGLTTSPIPHGLHTFELRFDFIDHHLRILKSDGREHLIPLKSSISCRVLSRGHGWPRGAGVAGRDQPRA